MKTILQEISEEKNFDAFIQEQMKISTYKPEWKKEMDTDFSVSGAYNEFVGEYAAAQAGSIIAKNADKPLREMPDLGSITGTIGRLGDRWQLDNDRLDKLMQLEGRYRGRAGNFTSERKSSEWQKVLKFLFNMYEPAAIAPHKRLDLLFYNGLSNGKYEVTVANNPDGVQWELDLKIPTYLLRASDVLFSDKANSDPVAVFQYVILALRAKGKLVEKIQMNFNTVQLVLESAKIKAAFSVDVPKGRVSPSGIISLEMLNGYLKVVGLPPIEVVDVFVTLPGTNQEPVNAFKDNRVVFRTSSPVAKLMLKDALESKDPHPNKVYTVYEENLISSYRREEGRFVEYEMNAVPVFNGKNDMAILRIDEKAA
ncbi:hypothetical protein [Parapedobacter indicus]|uniref:Phage major capsid protein E n=1 Tax=Parapedobacter indicus TaxID=1477437 RepID=A0A1I3E548_9SPHI|nr:hypothetical protein [Parapedobacter indicus]PPL04972.1 hypothetical protein CLV26_101783 [Parapedobacter indicus]SFH94094.1 hypothetical protein SAMN05444682_101769 [Parapedobacter indicus]